MPSLDPEDRLAHRIHGRNTLLAGCGTTVTVFMLAVFGYLAWANTLPAPEPDVRVLPSPNGYDSCCAVVASLRGGASTGTPWESDLDDLRKDLSPERPRLAALHAAVRLPYEAPANDPNYHLRFAMYRRTCRLLAAETRLELAAGRPGVAAQRALDAVELGAKIGRVGPWGLTLVGAACMGIGQNAAERCVPALSAPEAHATRKRLDEIFSQLPKPGDVMDTERRYSLAFVREVFAGRAPIASSPAAFGIPTTWSDRLKERAWLVVYPKSWGYGQEDQYWRSLAAELRKPYGKQSAPRLTLPDTDPVLGGSHVDFQTLQFPFARIQASLRLLRAELALREYHLQHGAYPAALQQLTPGELTAAALDPFVDQPLRYRRQGAGYVLYSVGPDLQDDGGLPIVSRGVSSSSKGDLVAGKLFTSRKASTSSPRY